MSALRELTTHVLFPLICFLEEQGGDQQQGQQGIEDNAQGNDEQDNYVCEIYLCSSALFCVSLYEV